MSLKPDLPTFLTAATFFLLAMIATTTATMAAEPKVYRCGPEGSQWFSQIPCEEDSTEVIVEDHHMFSETLDNDPLASDSGNMPTSAEADAASKAQAFITQLERQRSEQLAEIDSRIEALESQSAAGGDGSGPEGGGDSAAEGDQSQQLAVLQRNRQSMVSEYDAMINAARQRIDTP